MDPVYISFQPSPQQAFSFLATLDDGVQYVVVVTWSLFGNRWYVNVLTLQGVPIVVNYPAVGSPPDTDINLIGPWFHSVLVWRPDLRQFVITRVDTPSPVPSPSGSGGSSGSANVLLDNTGLPLMDNRNNWLLGA